MIINSLLDNDLYKITQMQAAYFSGMSDTNVRYKLFDRKNLLRLSQVQYEDLLREIDSLCNLKFTVEELNWLSNLQIGEQYIFQQEFLDKLANFKINRDKINIEYHKGMTIDLNIQGSWWDTILMEVPLMAIISECYHYRKTCLSARDYEKNALDRFHTLMQLEYPSKVYDFGTRRRFSKAFHFVASKALIKSCVLAGTSNMQIARETGTQPIGTVAHEWYMASYARVKEWDTVGDWNTIEDLEATANEWAMIDWENTYKGILGIALPDTFTTDKFLLNLNGVDARTLDGLRQDSGNPLDFVEKVINRYDELGIDPTTKRIIFSDSLTPAKCVQLFKDIRSKYGLRHPRLDFAIGTDLSNHTETQPLGIVIKMVECGGIPVYKLSDDPSKAIGVNQCEPTLSAQ